MGVSKNRGNPPKWMVKFHGKPYEQMDDLGVPLFCGNTNFLEDIHVYTRSRCQLMGEIARGGVCFFYIKWRRWVPPTKKDQFGWDPLGLRKILRSLGGSTFLIPKMDRNTS